MALNGSKTRSLPEIILYELIASEYPELQINRNDRNTLNNGLELDLFIPAINLAIEINGPTHYDNIFGELKLIRTELNDLRKKDKAEELGITLKVLNISSVPEKELRNFLVTFFTEEVLSLIQKY